ncbi:PFK domain-containing protein, partial [Haematococcus lacustris]
MLGTSRGGANVKDIVKRIDLWGLNMVFVVGGNGGNAAANAISEECAAQGVVCSVIGVPKSIDNDILLVDRCFGFETAVEEAQRALMAAKDLLAGHKGTDASGNPILADIGPFLRSGFKKYFKGEADIKYIDPTYMIRAIPTTANDRVYCTVLGQGAVHAAFAGYTDITVGLINTHYVYLPISTVIQAPRRVNPKGRRWNRLLTSINQPEFV